MALSFSRKKFLLKPIFFILFLSLLSCGKSPLSPFHTFGISKFFNKADDPKRDLNQQFKQYWYDGQAEITSFKLKQSRYGELREGTAVLVYVTEDFLPDEQVKANMQNENTVPVLKLNTTKKFLTGIYPYSIMSSTFYPLANKSHAIKVVNSSQEWCGQMYAQLNNRDGFTVTAHDYFEGGADQDFRLSESILEDELWTQLRTAPSELPTGSQKVIPSLEYLRLNHKKIKAYEAEITKTDSAYRIKYSELNRTLNIDFEPNFPFKINGWQETVPVGSSGKIQTSTAVKIKTLKTPYWKRTTEKYRALRDSLKI